jgi:hypothetical protein
MSVSRNGDYLTIGGKRFLKEGPWSQKASVDKRTTKRYRDLGLPWLFWSGEVFIGPEDEADIFLASLVKRRNTRRKRA